MRTSQIEKFMKKRERRVRIQVDDDVRSDNANANKNEQESMNNEHAEQSPNIKHIKAIADKIHRKQISKDIMKHL